MKDVRESGAWKTTLFFLPGNTSEEAITSATHQKGQRDLTLSVHEIAHRVGVDVRIDTVRYGLPRSANVRDLEDAYESPSLYIVTISSNNVLRKGKVGRVEREIDTGSKAGNVVFSVRLQLGDRDNCAIYGLGNRAKSTDDKGPLLLLRLFNVKTVKGSYGIAPNGFLLRYVHSDLNRDRRDGNYLNANLLPRRIRFRWQMHLFFIKGDFSLCYILFHKFASHYT